MAKAVAIFTGGIIGLKQIAVREGGAVFRRYQEPRGRYGYGWTAWTRSGTIAGEIPGEYCGLLRAEPHGANLNNRALFNKRGEIRVRLP